MHVTNLMTTPTLTVADIWRKLDEAQAQLSELRDDLGALALQAETGDLAAVSALAEHRQALHDTEERCATLQAALAAVEQQEAVRLSEQRRALQAAQLWKLKRLLNKKLRPAIEEMAQAWGVAIAAFQRAVQAQSEAIAACPLEFRNALETVCNPDALDKLLRDEACRLDGEMFKGAGRSEKTHFFPLAGMCNPADFRPMSEVIARHIKSALDRIERDQRAERAPSLAIGGGERRAPSLAAAPIAVEPSREPEPPEVAPAPAPKEPKPSAWDGAKWAAEHPDTGTEDELTREDREWREAVERPKRPDVDTSAGEPSEHLTTDNSGAADALLGGDAEKEAA